MTTNIQRQKDLLEKFVEAFPKLNEMAAFAEIYPLVAELAVGTPDELGRTHWLPSRTSTNASCLDPLYAKLPARFPPLYERLALSYRWADVDLQSFTLLANPPGIDLVRLFERISKDPALWQALNPAGFIQFAKGPDMDYDPVCFDLRVRSKSRDYRIVKIDHEQILCNNRVKVVAEVAPSFEELVRQTIAAAYNVTRKV